jgi:hypothetical protein
MLSNQFHHFDIIFFFQINSKTIRFKVRFSDRRRDGSLDGGIGGGPDHLRHVQGCQQTDDHRKCESHQEVRRKKRFSDRRMNCSLEDLSTYVDLLIQNKRLLLVKVKK